MPLSLRLALSILGLATLAAACGRDVPTDPTALDPATRSICTADVADLLEEAYSPGGLLNSRLSRCANYQRKIADGALVDATGMAFDLIEDILGDAADGHVMAAAGMTLEETIEALIAAILADIGLVDDPEDPDDTGGIVVETVDETGGEVVTPNAQGALLFDPDDLAGPTIVTIIQLPEPAMPMGCPFSFDPPHDCYPHFFDFSVTPEENLLDAVVGGLCVVEPPDPNAPTPEVAARLQITSEDEENPGTLIFWPLATPPPGLQCEEIIIGSAWQRTLFHGLGPLAHLFRVTPAYASPGGLGASMTSFSPFAATDPVPEGATGNVLIDCPVGDGGDFLSRGFYTLSWPGTTLEAVDLYFRADSAGTYGIELTARLDGYGGPLVGADTLSVPLPAGRGLETKATFTFPSPAIATGDTVAFSLTQLTGPTDPLFYSVPSEGDETCPIVETEGTTPTLDVFRRQGVKTTIYGAP